MVADDELDNFMPTFKYYKQRLNPPSFENVIDFASQNCKHPYSFIDPPENKQNLGLKCDSQWKLFQVKDVPGLFVIPNPFTDDGQVQWASRCLGSYACQPNKTNLDAFEKQYSSDRSLWNETCEQVGGELKKNGKSSHKKDATSSFKQTPVWKLRWATLGYHHNWNTKVYGENDRTAFPQELYQLSQVIAGCLGYNDYNAQAAIVNFYHVGSTLSAHTDESEHNLDHPLISVSFGLPAVFLIGGRTKQTAPTALLIRSGDVVVMTSQSRLAYHAVPRILHPDETPRHKEPESPETDPTSEIREAAVTSENQERLVRSYLSTSRINMNVRQLR